MKKQNNTDINLLHYDMVNVNSPEMSENKLQTKVKSTAIQELAAFSVGQITPTDHLNISLDDNFTTFRNRSNKRLQTRVPVTKDDTNNRNFNILLEDSDISAEYWEETISTDSDNLNVPEWDYYEEIRSRFMYYESFVQEQEILTREVEGCENPDETVRKVISFGDDDKEEEDETDGDDMMDCDEDVIDYYHTPVRTTSLPLANSTMLQSWSTILSESSEEDTGVLPPPTSPNSDSGASSGVIPPPTSLMTVNSDSRTSPMSSMTENSDSRTSSGFIPPPCSLRTENSDTEAPPENSINSYLLGSHYLENLSTNNSLDRVHFLPPARFMDSMVHDDSLCYTLDSLHVIASSSFPRDEFSLDNFSPEISANKHVSSDNNIGAESIGCSQNSLPGYAVADEHAAGDSILNKTYIITTPEQCLEKFSKKKEKVSKVRSSEKENTDQIESTPNVLELNIKDKKTIAKRFQRFRRRFSFKKNSNKIKTLATL